jgi:molybdopterin biosynthesis enzyme
MPAPPGSDAVLMLEDALLRGREVEATAVVVHPYRNIARVGEDVLEEAEGGPHLDQLRG